MSSLDSTPPDLTRREQDVLAALCRPALHGNVFEEPASVREIAPLPDIEPGETAPGDVECGNTSRLPAKAAGKKEGPCVSTARV